MPGKFEQYLERTIPPVEPTVTLQTPKGQKSVPLSDVMEADYSDTATYPPGWSAEKEMGMGRFYSEWSPFGPVRHRFRDHFDDYLRDNPDFSLAPYSEWENQDPGNTGDTGDTGDTDPYSYPTELAQELTDEAKAYLHEPHNWRLLEAAKRAIEQRKMGQEEADREAGSEGWGEIAKQVMGGKPFESGSVPISEIFKQAREGAANSAMETEANRNKAMTATLAATHPEKASEVPRATRMRESKRDVREDEEKQ